MPSPRPLGITGRLGNAKTSAQNSLLAPPASLPPGRQGPPNHVDPRKTYFDSTMLHVKLVVPATLGTEEDQHLRAYAAAGGQRVSPERGGFFKRKKKK